MGRGPSVVPRDKTSGPPDSITPESDGSLALVLNIKPVSNWIFGLEYLYYRFDDTNTGGGSWTFPNGQPAPFYACTTAGQNCARFSYGDMNVQTVRARVSYQFNGPTVFEVLITLEM